MSYAVVDATQYQGGDICAQISSVFSVYNTYNQNGITNGIVIDARGSSVLNCSTNPWSTLNNSGGNYKRQGMGGEDSASL